MDEIQEMLESLALEQTLKLEDIPDIDLYMDQVIQLFENKYERTKRNEKEKILTKTMINNYAKQRLFFPIKNKKYSKEHLILISLIYQLKGTLSINDIKTTLEQLNKKVNEDQFTLDDLYQSYLHLQENQVEGFKDNIYDSFKEVESEVAQLNDVDTTYLEKLLLVISLANMSNFYRRAAEKIVDELYKKRRE